MVQNSTVIKCFYPCDQRRAKSEASCEHALRAAKCESSEEDRGYFIAEKSKFHTNKRGAVCETVARYSLNTSTLHLVCLCTQTVNDNQQTNSLSYANGFFLHYDENQRDNNTYKETHHSETVFHKENTLQRFASACFTMYPHTHTLYESSEKCVTEVGQRGQRMILFAALVFSAHHCSAYFTVTQVNNCHVATVT